MQNTITNTDPDLLRDSLKNLPEPVVRPLFIVVSGLPGTGKSLFSRSLSQRIPLAILEADALRRALFGNPSYSDQESARLFQACHKLIEELLAKGIPVLLDATNLVEFHRERLYRIAERVEAKLVLISIEAPVKTVRRRLKARFSALEPKDHSQADWSIYKRMRTTAQPIGRSHYVVDTSRDTTPVLEKIVWDIKPWLRG